MENCVKTVGTIRKRSEFLQSLKNEDKNAAKKYLFLFHLPLQLSICNIIFLLVHTCTII